MLLWRDAPRIWKAKGYTSHAAAADALEERFGSGKGLGRTSISLLVTTQYEPCSPEVEAFIRHELAIKNEETWARYLAEVANEPPEEGAREPAAEVARPGTATIDTAETALGQANAALGQASERLGHSHAALGAASERLAHSHVALGEARGKLDESSDALGQTRAKLEAASGRLVQSAEALHESNRRLDRLTWAVGLVGVGLVALAVAHARPGPAPLPPVPPPAPVASVPAPAPVFYLNIVPGLLEEAAWAQQGGPPVLLGPFTAGLGRKTPPELWVTKEPLPGQKLPPCDAGIGEVALNGACWANQGDVQPPCGRLYRNGNKCYRPVAAEPHKPVTDPPPPRSPQPY